MSGLSLLILVGALAQPTPGISTDPEYVDINFGQDGITLEEMIKWWSEATNRPLSFKENDFRGKGRVMITGTVRVEKSQLDNFFQALLHSQGFALIPVGPRHADLRRAEPIDSSRVLKTTAEFVEREKLAEYADQTGRVVMTTIQLKHLPVSSVRGAVTQLLTNRAAEFAQEVPANNSLVLVGFAPTLNALNRLLTVMDIPAPKGLLPVETKKK
ncbi:MAG: hypothetical protein CMJ83_18755 [Planctomycetes bacterium]|nr:hypothetical protein [Planctomycetota bacterium]